jgi:hypothetical protein
MPEQRRKRLRPRIDAQALLPKRQRRAIVQGRAWRELTQQ